MVEEKYVEEIDESVEEDEVVEQKADDILTEIRKHSEKGNLIFGKEATVKGIMDKTVKKLVLSSNIPDSEEAEIKKMASLSDIETVVVDKRNDELGQLCKKPFSVSVLGIKG